MSQVQVSRAAKCTGSASLPADWTSNLSRVQGAWGEAEACATARARALPGAGVQGGSRGHHRGGRPAPFCVLKIEGRLPVTLTRALFDVLDGAAHGLTTKHLSRQLNKDIKTLEAQRAAIMQRLNAHNMFEACYLFGRCSVEFA